MYGFMYVGYVDVFLLTQTTWEGEKLKKSKYLAFYIFTEV